MYLVHTGDYNRQRGNPTAQEILNMDDGWDQEEQSVRRLAAAGIRVEDRQFTVSLGKSRIPGHGDGTVTYGETKYVWEHKAYDANAMALMTLEREGFDALPNQKSQINGYMLGLGLDKGIFFVKVKNTNDYVDVVVKRDDAFIGEIVGNCDRIKLGGWVPEPKKCDWCSNCGVDCFGTWVDFGKIRTSSEEEVAQRWLEGDKLVKIGELMKDEARAFFVGDEKTGIEGIIGDADALVVPDVLEIKRIRVRRFDVKKELVLERFGPEALALVGEETNSTQYRFKSLL
jgi:hypothetical protein